MFVFSPWAPFACGSNPTRLCRLDGGGQIRPAQLKNKMPKKGHLIFVADGEGFEPPVELPPQRFSRPPHSTALPTIRNCFPSVFQPSVLVFHMTLSCSHSTSLTLVVKTRTPQHTLPTIRNCFPSVFQPSVLVFHMTLSCSHSTSLTLVVKTRTPQHTLPTIRNCFPISGQRRVLYIIFCELQT